MESKYEITYFPIRSSDTLVIRPVFLPRTASIAVILPGDPPTNFSNDRTSLKSVFSSLA